MKVESEQYKIDLNLKMIDFDLPSLALIYHRQRLIQSLL